MERKVKSLNIDQQTGSKGRRDYCGVDIPSDLRKEMEYEFLERKRRQQLRESSEELRHLQRQLGFALSFKQLSEQKASLEREKTERVFKKRQENQELQRQISEYQEEGKRKETIENDKKEKHRQKLLEQINVLQATKKQTVEELAKDRERLQELMENFKKLETEQLSNEQLIKKEVRMALDEFMRAKKAKETEEKLRDTKEIQQANEVQALREQEKQKNEIIKKQQMKQNEDLNLRMGLELKKERDEKLKRDQIMQELLIQEKKAIAEEKLRHRLVAEELHQKHVKQQLQEDYKATQQRKQLERETETELDRENARKLLAQLEKDRILESEKKDKRTLELRSALLDGIERKKLENKQRFTENLNYEKERLQHESERAHDVEQERLYLLKQQPIEILRFLPPGVLTKSEREQLGLDTCNYIK